MIWYLEVLGKLKGDRIDVGDRIWDEVISNGHVQIVNPKILNLAC